MFKTILVHLRGTKEDAAALSAALEAGCPNGAHLNCLHIRPNLAGLISRMAFDMDEDADRITEYLDTLRKMTDDIARAAAQAFTEFCTREGIIRVGAPPAPTA